MAGDGTAVSRIYEPQWGFNRISDPEDRSRMAEQLPVIQDPDFLTLDRSAQEKRAMAALLEAGEDPTDPELVDQVIDISTRSPLWAPSKRGQRGLLFRYKVATQDTDTAIAQALGVSRQAVNNIWHSQQQSREFTPAQRDLLLQRLLLQRRRIDAVIEELRQL
jgi:hypothetical protein